jgi:hypothetical protein
MPFVNTSVIRSNPGPVPLDNNLPVLPKRDPSRMEQIGFFSPSRVQVTGLVKHMRDNVIREFIDKHNTIVERPLPERPLLIKPRDKVRTNAQRGFWEHVSDLSGLAVTAAFEWRFCKRITAFVDCKNIPTDKHLQEIWFAKSATQYEAQNSGYQSRLLQMGKLQWNRFGWLVGHLDRAVDRIADEVMEEGGIMAQNLQFELDLAHEIPIPGRPKQEQTVISGRSDIVFDPGDGRQATIWEIKLVQSLEPPHVAQLIQYGLLWAAKYADAPFPRLLLFNVRDGARWEIVTTREKARSFVEDLLRAKYTVTKPVDDEEFLRLCGKTMDEVVDRI